MSYEVVFGNARIALADRIVKGNLVIRGSRIAELEPGGAPPWGCIDCGGDLVMPGMVEIHTDNLEKHVAPRPGVKWPLESAVLAHDAQVATAGVTTVCDAITVGDIWNNPARSGLLREMVGAIDAAIDARSLRCDHLLHLRAELSHANLLDSFEGLAENPRVRVVTLMDHTPGQRQFADESVYRRYYQGKAGLGDAEMDALLERHRDAQRRHAAPNRARVLEIVRARGFVAGSHDDACASHVDEAAEAGLCFSEFPTTAEAAHRARDAGLAILLGAPNAVRGGSHSGNVSALDLGREGLVDLLSSDYVPASLIHGVARMHRDSCMPLPQAIATVTSNPARLLGLDDRGTIAVGKRADVIRVDDRGPVPVIRGVWRAGERVA